MLRVSFKLAMNSARTWPEQVYKRSIGGSLPCVCPHTAVDDSLLTLKAVPWDKASDTVAFAYGEHTISGTAGRGFAVACIVKKQRQRSTYHVLTLRNVRVFRHVCLLTVVGTFWAKEIIPTHMGFVPDGELCLTNPKLLTIFAINPTPYIVR